MKRLTTADAATLALFFGTCALTAKVYSSLPAVMPTHFDLRGVANGWMPRQVGAWILPVVALVTAVVVRLGALALPPAWKERLARSPTDMVALLVAAFMTALQCVLLYAAIAKPPSTTAAVLASADHDQQICRRPNSIYGEAVGFHPFIQN
jgi:uncharacterized membrane protein